MPIVAGNEPQPEKKSRGSGCGGLIILLVFLWRPLFTMIRGFTNGRISDEQILIIVGGICVLVVLAALVQRASRLRGNTTTTLPTSYSLPPSLSSSMQQRSANEQYLPPTPRFEPIITGKLVLAGMMLMFLLGGIGLLLLWMI